MQVENNNPTCSGSVPHGCGLSHSLRTTTLTQLCSDWLSLANRSFKLQVGGASVLTSIAVY